MISTLAKHHLQWLWRKSLGWLETCAHAACTQLPMDSWKEGTASHCQMLRGAPISSNPLVQYRTTLVQSIDLDGRREYYA
ncbi:hypothetical protein RJ035_007712, partial [Blastomyces gilchristii]